MILEMVEQGEMTVEQGRKEYKEMEEEDNEDLIAPAKKADHSSPTTVEKAEDIAVRHHEGSSKFSRHCGE